MHPLGNPLYEATGIIFIPPPQLRWDANLEFKIALGQAGLKFACPGQADDLPRSLPTKRE